MNKSEKEKLLEKRRHGKPLKAHLHEFGLLFGAIFVTAAIYCLWIEVRIRLSAAVLVLLGGVCVFLAYRRPLVLYYPWMAWMGLGAVLGRIVNPVILLVLWVVGVVPTALMLRLCGKKVMDLRFRARVESYWEDRDPADWDFKSLENQY